MVNLCDNKYLTAKYDILQLIVCQNVLHEIERDVNELAEKYINHLDELKGIYAHVWVNPLLFDIFIWLRSQGLHKQIFTHHVNFNLNKKMKDNEYAVFNLCVKILENYTVKGDDENV